MCADDAATADRELAARHRVMWASGDYRRIADDLVAPLGPALVRASGVGRGDRVLDVAAGTGSAAIAAASTGARVTASDLTPELLAQGKMIAAERGVDLDWREANAEQMPFADNDFDAVLSCIGVMFAPHHQRAADELVRVCRPGGTIALLNWTPQGFLGEMLATMKPYLPAPPPGAQPPPLWGSEDHVRALLGERVSELAMQREYLAVDLFGSGQQCRDFFKAHYGPTIAAYNSIDEQSIPELDSELAELAQRYLAGSSTMQWEYLVVTARKR